jgi:excisionase family DNA binding protein|tara:strand:+ start:249 stop:482 length:234 start_codon:yes stop_codon:yes gene_type:complete
MTDSLKKTLKLKSELIFSNQLLIIKAIASDKWYSVNETAKYLKLDRKTIIKYIRSGEIKAKSFGKKYLINKLQFHDI